VPSGARPERRGRELWPGFAAIAPDDRIAAISDPAPGHGGAPILVSDAEPLMPFGRTAAVRRPR
jgi:hypothetical protein